jgi:hypothetical protein
MTTWNVALVREQSVEFAVILVKDSVIESPSIRDDLIASFMAQLQGRPVVLLGEQRYRTYGRQDVVRWMANIHPSRLPDDDCGIIPDNNASARINAEKASARSCSATGKIAMWP